MLLLLLLPAVPVLAQQKARFHIASFRENPEDLTPKTHEKRDADGNPYAIIKVTSTNPDDDLSAYHFSFEHIPYEVEVKDGELWVYVGRNAMYVNIIRDGYHSINHYELNTTIQQGRAYEMKLSAEPKKVLKQMVRFNVSPAQSNAVVMYKSESSGADEQLFGVAGENGSVAKNLELGRYSYKIISDNYYLSEGLFYLNDVNSVHTENVTLKPNFASIELVAVEGAGILIDGEEKGRGSWKGILKGGKYNVECRKENHKSTFETLEIEAGRDRSVTLASPIPIIGILSLNSMPLDAKITIDGKEHGLTPRNINDLIVGSHKVKISKSGYIDASFDVVIKEGETTEHTVTLQRAAQNSSNNSKVQGSSGNLANAGKTDAGNKSGAERTLDSAKSAIVSSNGKISGHEYVDLGLPSGTLWATCNVGASKPEEYGNYYAWGETSTKSYYFYDNSVTYGKNFSDIGGNPAYDVACKQWGSPWRLPTKAEFDELIRQCTWTWTTQNGIKGYKVTSKKNGNSIFLPAAGWRNGTSLSRQGVYGYYWSSTPHESNSHSAYGLLFLSGNHGTNWLNRYDGRSVRPVSGGIENKTEKTSNAKPASNELSTRTFKVKDVEFTMVAVEGGTFSMGSNDGFSNEKPIHQVTLDDYYIGETEVTQALWQAVMGSNPSYFKGTSNPVEEVNYKDCIRFIKKLNKLLKDQLPQGRKFRLPTEAEWEFAARGGNKSKGCKYSGSNSISTVVWYDGNSGSKTHPVKQKASNELGLYDMCGNVYEWCSDWYGYYYYSFSPQNNPKGPGSGSYRVLRGGSWINNEQRCRSANRISHDPGYRYYCYGLRLAF